MTFAHLVFSYNFAVTFRPTTGDESERNRRKRTIPARTGLSNSERRAWDILELATATVGAAVAQYSRDFRYVWANQAYAAWIQRPVDAIVGRSIAEVKGTEAFESLRRHFERVLTGETVQYEEEVNFRGIGRRWINATYTPTLDADGVVEGWVAVVVDITERRRAEDALRQSEARRTTEAGALAKLNDWSARLRNMSDLHQGLDEILRAVIELLGADKGNVQLLDADRGVLTIAAQHGFDQGFLDVFREVSATDPSACGSAMALGRRVVVEDLEVDARFSALRAVGRASGFRAVVSTPLFNKDARLTGMLSAHFASPYRSTDESLSRLDLYVHQAASFIERCETERTIRESEARFRLIANTAPVMIWMTGIDKLCTYVNKGWLDFTGRPFEAELGNGWADGVHTDDVVRCMNTYADAFDRREPFWMEYRSRRRDGDYRWILDQGVPRFSVDGAFAGYIGSCIDVTERRLAEEALATLSRQMIAAQEEERTRLARELHDDVNQRLALLAIQLEKMRQDESLSSRKLRDGVGDALTRLSELTQDVQKLSYRLHASKLELMGLAMATRALCRDLSRQHGVKIGVTVKSVPPVMPRDVSLSLYRVLQEALQNAIKHSGTRHIQTALTGGRDKVELTVSDAGVGFEAALAFRGGGLGLISMRERVKLVHGELSIHSTPQSGTIIRARVPIERKRTARPA